MKMRGLFIAKSNICFSTLGREGETGAGAAGVRAIRWRWMMIMMIGMDGLGGLLDIYDTKVFISFYQGTSRLQYVRTYDDTNDGTG